MTTATCLAEIDALDSQCQWDRWAVDTQTQRLRETRQRLMAEVAAHEFAEGI